VVIRIAAIQSSVMLALRDSGGRNAGTPSAMASIPVSAAHPEANARRIRNRVSGWDAGGTTTASLGARVPATQRQKPAARSRPMLAMNR
jgi:hypothetical protein